MDHNLPSLDTSLLKPASAAYNPPPILWECKTAESLKLTWVSHRWHKQNMLPTCFQLPRWGTSEEPDRRVHCPCNGILWESQAWTWVLFDSHERSLRTFQWWQQKLEEFIHSVPQGQFSWRGEKIVQTAWGGRITELGNRWFLPIYHLTNISHTPLNDEYQGFFAITWGPNNL